MRYYVETAPGPGKPCRVAATATAEVATVAITIHSLLKSVSKGRHKRRPLAIGNRQCSLLGKMGQACQDKRVLTQQPKNKKVSKNSDG